MPGSVGAPLGGDTAIAFNTGHSSGVEALEALGVHNVSEKRSHGTENINLEEKGATEEIRYVAHDVETIEMGKGMTAAEKVDNMEEIALFALHVEDDFDLNPWTVCTPLLAIFSTGMGKWKRRVALPQQPTEKAPFHGFIC